jgi:hypothetical protein
MNSVFSNLISEKHLAIVSIIFINLIRKNCTYFELEIAKLVFIANWITVETKLTH